METFSGEDLWKSGKSAGRVHHSGSEKYASQNEMICSISAAPFIFADEHFWFVYYD